MPRARRRVGRPLRSILAALVAVAVLLVPTTVGATPPAPRGPPRVAGPAAGEIGALPAPPVAPGASNGSGLGWYNISEAVSSYGADAPIPVETGAAVALDASTGVPILFGGDDASGGAENTTWELGSNGWVPIDPGGPAPPGGADATMDYDPGAGGVLLYGGPDAPTLRDGMQTWLFRNGSWADLTPTLTGPSPPVAHGDLVYDAAEGASILLGGTELFGAHAASNLTWSFQNGSWSNLTASAGSPLASGTIAFGGAAYDDRSDRIVSIWDDETDDRESTWAFADGAWSHLAIARNPSSRVDASLAYDPALNGTVAVNGWDGFDGTDPGETWLFNGSAWKTLPSVGDAGDRAGAAMTYDPAENSIVLVGGYDESIATGLSDTWVLTNRSLDDPTAAIEVPGLPTETYVRLAFSADTGPNGVGPYDVLWTFGDSGEAFTRNASHGYIVPGNDSVVLNVTDALGDSALANLPLEVLPGPLLSVASTPVASAPNGTSLRFSANASSGTAPYDIAWSIGNGATLGLGPEWNYTFPSTGSYVVDAHLRDARNGTAAATLRIGIFARLGLIVQLSADPGEVRRTVQMNATLLGGEIPEVVNWSFGDGSSTTGFSVAHTYGAPGPYTVVADARDAFGETANVSVPLEIEPLLTLNDTVRPRVGDVGASLPFEAEVESGVGPYAVTWSFGDGATSFVANASHAYRTPGTFQFTLNVRDASGVEVGTSGAVQINSDPVVAIDGLGDPVVVGEPVAISAVAKQGVGPFTYRWTLPNASTAAGGSVVVVFAAVGAYPVALEIVDPTGVPAWANATATVQLAEPTGPAAPSAGGLGGAGGFSSPILLGLVAAGLAAAIVAAWIDRRRNSPRPDEPGSPEPERDDAGADDPAFPR